MKGKPSVLYEVSAPELYRTKIVYYEKTDAAEKDKPREEKQHGDIIGEGRETVRIKGETRITERHHRIEYRSVPHLGIVKRNGPRRRTFRKKRPEHHRTDSLNGENGKDYPERQLLESAHARLPVRVHHREFARERKSSTHHDQEKGTHRHDIHTRQVHKADKNHLTEQRWIRPRIDYRETCYANGRTGSEKRIPNVHPRARRRRHRKHQKKCADENRAQETDCD